MVVIKSLTLALTLFIASNTWAYVPTESEVIQSSAFVTLAFEDFTEKPNQRNFSKLKSALQDYNDVMARARISINSDNDGAATKKAIKAVQAVAGTAMIQVDQFLKYRTENGEALSEAGFEQKFEDLMVNKLEFPLIKLTFGVVRHGVDEKVNVDGRVTPKDIVSRAFRAMVMDIVNIFTPGRNRLTGEWYWRPLEISRREALARHLIQGHKMYALKNIPEFNRLYDGNFTYDRENHEERLGGLLIGLKDRGVNIRSEWDSAQRGARFAYLAIGAVLAQPVFNVFGSSYSAHAETSFVTASIFASLYILKGMTSSMKSTRAWIDFGEAINNTMDPGLIKSSEIFLSQDMPREYHRAVIPRFIRWEMQLRSILGEKINQMAETRVGQIAVSVGSTCRSGLSRARSLFRRR